MVLDIVVRSRHDWVEDHAIVQSLPDAFEGAFAATLGRTRTAAAARTSKLDPVAAPETTSAPEIDFLVSEVLSVLGFGPSLPVQLLLLAFGHPIRIGRAFT